MTKLLPKKHLVADSFGRAADHYDDVAVLQRQTADQLLKRIDSLNINPKKVLDLGTGTGRNLSLLAQRFLDAQLIAVDIAPAMLNKARYRFFDDSMPSRDKAPYFLAGDAEKLPLADNSVDFIFASLSLQWCDPKASFSEIERVLSDDGVVIFSSLAPLTLHELRHAWATVDSYPHVNEFYSLNDVHQAMVSAGLSQIALDVSPTILKYAQALDLMKDLKILGARNLNDQRLKGLTGKNNLQKVQAAYDIFRQGNSLPATYEVLFGLATKTKKSL
jgi:malonyl-CoA O-methyltransferase